MPTNRRGEPVPTHYSSLPVIRLALTLQALFSTIHPVNYRRRGEAAQNEAILLR